MNSAEVDTSTMRYIEPHLSKYTSSADFPSNAIISSHSTKFSFLPRSLFLRFLSLPKLWFLVISILELTDSKSTSLGYGTVLPLALLILLEVLHDSYNDYQRHTSDSKINSQLQRVWDGSTFITKQCKDILVGDIILLENNETSPADLVILSVGNEEHECYADVSLVIGESNLKVKHPIKEVQSKLESLDCAIAGSSLSMLKLEIEVNLPNKSFKQFSGRAKLTQSPKAAKLDIDNLLLRGMRITNTPWIFGLAVYTGVETKVWINNLMAPNKVPLLRKITDRWMTWMVLGTFVFCCIFTLVSHFLRVPGYLWNEILEANLILFGHMVPISLYLTIEIVRILLTLAHSHYHAQIALNSASLMSNLGMVEYILTDKTGTLTENTLDTVLLSVNDKLYFHTDTLTDQEPTERNYSDARLHNKHRAPENYYGDMYSFRELYEEFSQEESPQKLFHFFTCLAICNLAFPAEDTFVAISVDDKVLARTAAEFGVRMVSRDSENIVLDVKGLEMYFEVLGTKAFSSDIKTSRIVVKNPVTCEAVMYVKGSRESMVSMYDLNSYSRMDLEDGILQYRTLFLGYKRLSPEETQEFQFDYETAQLSPVNREGRVEVVFQKYEKGLEYLGIVGLEDIVTEETKQTVKSLREAGIKMWVLSGDSEESTLTSSISAGIFKTENKILRLVNFSSELDCMNILQNLVRENIFPEQFMDKLSLDEDGSMSVPMAISEANIPNLGSVFSALSVEDMMPVAIPRRKMRKSTLFVRDEQRRATVHPLVSRLSMYKKKASLEGEYNPKNLKFILSVDSSGLEYGTSTKELLKYFTALLFTARAVCFHSLLPDQKTKVVKLIKQNFRFSPIVMTVGDGISDVGMIHAADIGIGVQGKESSEAALNSDISIRRFHDLLDLVLVFGHRRYMQLCKIVLLSFYVMALLEFQLIMYYPVSAWTAQTLIEAEFVMIYRLVVNILPVVALCLVDVDSGSNFITPKAYKIGIFNKLMTVKNLCGYFLVAGLQAAFTFLCTEFFFSAISPEGKTENTAAIGTSVFLIISATVYLSILVETYSISLLTLFVYLCCIILYIAAVVPTSYTNLDIANYHEFVQECPNIWIYLVFTTTFNVTICYTSKVFKYLYFPDIIEKIRTVTPNNSIQLDSRIKQYRKTLKCVYKESAIFQRKSNYDDTALNYRLMKFKSKYREMVYQADKLAENSTIFRVLLLLAGLSISLYSIYSLSSTPPQIPAIIFHVICSLTSLFLFIVPSLSLFRIPPAVYLIITYLFMQCFYFVSQLSFEFPSLSMCSFLPILYIVGFSNYWKEMTLLVLPSLAIAIVVAGNQFLPLLSNYSLLGLEVACYCVTYLGVCLMSSLVAYHIDKSKRKEFVLVQKVQIEIQKTKSVLSYLLPAFVMQRVQDGVRYISDNQGVVSVIFCDIYNFESILKYYNPQELTAFLDEVFDRFDQICMLSGCTKIETVGKTYMACAGLKDSETELDPYYSNVSHARRCIEMGLAIIRNAEKIFLRNREVLQFKIGINSGVVTAGVVGFHKPQFSLVGDTVNTASRMASLCAKPNTLQISKKTFKLIGDKTGLVLLPSQVDAKGKGLMNTFLVSVPEIEGNFSPSKGMSLSETISEVFKKKGPRKAVSDKKKVTLFHFNNMHSEHNNRKSSVMDDLEKEIVDEREFVRKQTEAVENIKWFSIGCKETKKEKQFRIESSEAAYPIAMNGLLLRVSTDGILLLLLIIEISLRPYSSLFEVLVFVFEILVFSILAVKFKQYHSAIWYSWLISLVCISTSIIKVFAIVNKERMFISYIYHLLQAAHCSQLLFKNFIWTGFILVATIIIYASLEAYENWLLHIIAGLMFYFIILFTLYTREKKLRFFATLKTAAEKKLAETEQLLTQMMPKHVFESLKEHSSVTESISKVTVMYADIVGFTAWSAQKTPEEVVGMLSDLFTEFDKKCMEYEVYKVHTIGDCYVAMGYTGSKPRSETVECFRLAKFALALTKIIKEKNQENQTELNMRIGMHTGDIIGGIAGTNIVRYDIYGIDVYIANKMESTGKAGCVKISETTMKILHDNWPTSFVFNRNDNVEIPITNSRIKTYFLENNPAEEMRN